MTDSDVFAPVRFSTADLPERHRLTAWREQYCRAALRLDVEPAKDEPFECALVSRTLPGLQLMSTSTSAIRITRTAEFITSNDLILIINRMGESSAVSRGREVTLGKGDAVLMSSADVKVFDRHSRGGSLALRMPRSVLASAVADIDGAVMRLIPRHAGVLKLLTGYASPLLGENALISPELRQTVVNHVYDLVALTLGVTHDVTDIAMERGARAAWLRSAKSYIIDNSSRRNLSIGAVASHLRVTPRYLQRLFEGEGGTFSAFLLEQRLTRARRMLTEPRLVRSAVSAIAYDVGFGDLSYFNRCFKQRYGATPSDVRVGAAK